MYKRKENLRQQSPPERIETLFPKSFNLSSMIQIQTIGEKLWNGGSNTDGADGIGDFEDIEGVHESLAESSCETVIRGRREGQDVKVRMRRGGCGTG